MKPTRCGRVALFGPPNAGKSTLLNALIGQKITIVTPKPQTTRTQIVGILTEGESQAIFLDTPGLGSVRGRLSKLMMQSIWESLREADVIVPVLDGNLYIRHPEAFDADLAPIVNALSQEMRPMIVVVNKVDLFSDKTLMLPLFERLSSLWPRAEVFPTSALEKDGIRELKELISRALPEGEMLYPEDQVSTAPVRFLASELIREKLFLYLRQEVPYGVAVEIEGWEEVSATGQTVINAVIYVAKPLHKGMVIGHNGQTIKKIGSEARQDLITLLGGKVHLELWVKVREHWMEDPSFLMEQGLMGDPGE